MNTLTADQAIAEDLPEDIRHINRIDQHLRVLAEIGFSSQNPIQLKLQLFYDTDPLGTLSFNLHEYSIEDCQELVKNIAQNAFLMRQIDEYLAADFHE